jgi:hypothetical protein
MIYMNTEITRDEKQEQINQLEETRNTLFKEAYKLRPGGEYNPLTEEPVTRNQIMNLIENWGSESVAQLEKSAPETAQLLKIVDGNLNQRQLASLAKVGEE